MAFLDALPKQTERAFMASIVKLARLLRWATWHDRATNFPRACPACKAPFTAARNDPGFPDLVLVRGDTLWFVELKTDRGVLSDSQQDWYEALLAVKKIRVGVWRPRDIEKIMKVMR